MAVKKKSQMLEKGSRIEVVRGDVKQIMYPKDMDLKDVIRWCIRKQEEEEEEVSIHNEFDCFPLDGAVQLMRSLEDVYGMTHAVATPGFWGPTPPKMVGVPVSKDKVIQVPWGRLAIPVLEGGYLQTGLRITRTGPKFVLQGCMKKKFTPEVDEIVEKLQTYLRDRSIYRGKAIKLDMAWVDQYERDGNGDNIAPEDVTPRFSIPTDQVSEDQLILPLDAEKAIRLNVFTPIQYSDACRAAGIPLKRGALLAGEYGTGKTLTAFVTAKLAVQNGWTFIYLNDVRYLAQTFQVAAQYAPAVIFAEDIDRAIGHERTTDVDKILNSFDGVDSKHSEIITVLTTNHLQNISQALLRPGRCDVLVEMKRPDKQAAQKLVTHYGGTTIASDAVNAEVGNATAGFLPAEIRETVERAKLATIARLASSGEAVSCADDLEGRVNSQDIVDSAVSMEGQHHLLQPLEPDTRSDREKAADRLGSNIVNAALEVAKRNGFDIETLQLPPKN